MRRCAASALILAMTLTSAGVDAQQPRTVTDVRIELLEEQKHAGSVLVELRDGSRISGAVTRPRGDRCEIGGQAVAYSRIVAFLDPGTGTVIALVRRPGNPPAWAPRQYSTRTVTIVGVAVGVFLLWLRLSIPS